MIHDVYSIYYRLRSLLNQAITDKLSLPDGSPASIRASSRIDTLHQVISIVKGYMW